MAGNAFGKFGMRSLSMAGAVVALVASTLALAGASTASAQEAVPVTAVPQSR